MPDLEDLIILEYARRRGIPEEKAREWIEALKSSEGDERAKKLQELLAILGDSAETLSRLPQELRGPAAAIVASQIAPATDGGSSLSARLSRALERAAELKVVLSALDSGDQKVEELRRELQEIREGLLQLAREREEAEKNQLAEALNRLLERMDELEQRIASLESAPRQEGGPRDPAEIIIRAREEAEKLTRALEALGFKVERKGYNLQEILRELEAMGFEVKRRYITPEELEELKRRIEEETRKKLEVEMGIEQKRLELIGGLLKDILNNLVTRVAEAWLEARREQALQSLRERVRILAQQQQAEEPGGGEAGSSAGPEERGGGEAQYDFIDFTILGGGGEGGGPGEEGGGEGS